MTKAVARMPLAVADKHKGTIAELTKAIQIASSIDDLQEARARIEAVKAWAKVHGLAKQMRLDLLRIEVEALVRIADLGASDVLSPNDRKAADWLACKSPADRARLINESGSATTAVGMCRAIWREDEVRDHRRQCVNIGRKLAEEPTPPKFDQEGIELARDLAKSVSGSLAKITDEYIRNGAEFTIDELANEIIHDASLPDDMAEDEAVNRGVRQVCREAVRRSPPLTINGTVIPRIITARNGRHYIRIPVLNATVAHLDDMIAMRREQLEQDRLAVEKLEDFAKMLGECPGASPEARIGQLVAESITEDTKAAS